MNTLTSRLVRPAAFAKNYGLFALMLVMLAMLPAIAGTDNTFTAVTDMVTDWAQGSLGKLISIAAFIVGMGIGLVRQSVMAVVIGIAFALVMFYGPDVIANIITFAV